MTISADIRILEASIESDALHAMTSDGHAVRIPAPWLIEHVRTSDLSTNPAEGRDPWDATFTSDLVPLDIDRDDDRRAWLDMLHTQGLSKLGPHESGEHDLRKVATSIGPVRPTNYGDVWTVDATIDPVTAVDSERALRVHTDLPYLDNPPGVQLMMVDNNGVEGGDSTFVDGFAVAEHIRTTDLEAWRLLTTIDFSYPFIRDDIEMLGRAPLIRLRSNGTYAHVSRAPDLVGVPFVSADNTSELYRAVRLWDGLLDGDRFERRVRVNPGEVVAWDNHRVLHGRTGFQLGSHGRRILWGCYVDMDFLRNEQSLASTRSTPGSQRPH